MKYNINVILITSMVILFFGCMSTDTKPVIEIEAGKIGMIGYGSLTSRKAVEKILGRPYKDSIYFVHLEDHQRVWNFAGSNDDPGLPEELLTYDSFYLKGKDTIPFKKTLFLNIEPKATVDLNCVLYFITLEEMDKFDDMELGYARIDVTNNIKEFDFKGGRVVAYKALPDYIYKPDTDKSISVIDKEYADEVLQAYDNVGVDYRKEFDNSTVALDTSMVVEVLRVKKKEQKVTE